MAYVYYGNRKDLFGATLIWINGFEKHNPVPIPRYLDLEQAREALAEIGVDLNARQMKRDADKDATGRRKLPFFVDPIEGKLKIEKGTLVRIYRELQIEAESGAKR